LLPDSGNIFPVHRVQLALPKAKLGEKNFPELSVLPAVDEDVDAGIEHQQEVGHLHQQVTPAKKSSLTNFFLPACVIIYKYK
jgi:hypothetical protein